MKVIREVSEDEVWGEWLRTEYKERVDKKLHHACERLVSEPDYTNQDDNNQRKQLLLPIRGPMIERIPNSTRWILVELNANDYKRLYILGWWTFNILSDFTGRLGKASKNIIDPNYAPTIEILPRIDPSEFDHHRNKVNGILAKRTYKNEFKPLLVGRSLDNAPTIIDGCHRSLALYAACFITGESQYTPIQAYLGVIGNKRTGLAIQPCSRLRRKNRKIQIECYGQAKGVEIAKQMLKSKIERQNIFLINHKLPSLGTKYIEEIDTAAQGNDSYKTREDLRIIEERYDKVYFNRLISLMPEEYRLQITDKTLMSGVNNPFNASWRISNGQTYFALMSASIEPFLGFLHAPESGWPGIMNVLSLTRDFSEINRPVYDDIILDFLWKIHDENCILGRQSTTKDSSNVFLSDGDYDIFLSYLAGLHGWRRPLASAGLQSSLEASIVKVITSNNLSQQLRKEVRLFSKYLRGEIEEWTPTYIHIK